MKIPTCDETGGVLLELVVFAFILALFTAGAARVHVSLGRRFEALVDARNQNIRAARAGLAAP